MRPPAIVSNPFPVMTPRNRWIHRCHAHGCRMYLADERLHCPRCENAA